MDSGADAGSGSISVKDVNRALRRVLWPALKAVGFTSRTDRVAWRYVPGGTELIETRSIGPGADAVGCPSFSFSVTVATMPTYLENSRVAVKDGRPRPHYWQCALSRRLCKTLAQPWFAPFSTPPTNLLPSFALHREGLMRVGRTDVHDRDDIWFVRSDGSNLDECVRDATTVVVEGALPWLEGLRDPESVIGNRSRRRLLNCETAC